MGLTWVHDYLYMVGYVPSLAYIDPTQTKHRMLLLHEKEPQHRFHSLTRFSLNPAPRVQPLGLFLTHKLVLGWPHTRESQLDASLGANKMDGTDLCFRPVVSTARMESHTIPDQNVWSRNDSEMLAGRHPLPW